MAHSLSARSEQIKKTNFVKDLNQLKIQQRNLEKERQCHVLNKRGEFYEEFQYLEEAEKRQSDLRTAIMAKLQQQLNVIRNKVKKFSKELREIKPNPEFVQKLKVLMEEVEGHISSLKEQEKKEYDDLMKDEKITSMEIEALDKKFDSWSVPASTESKSKKTGQLTIARDITEDLPPEVAAFERFVEQSGGVRGGWDEYDHSTFMKFRVKHKGRPGFVRELIPNLPTRSEQEVIEHERWFERYLDLNEEKKAAIQKWREKREVEKEAVVVQGEEDVAAAEEDERQEKERRQQAQYERIEKIQLLNKWKIDRELKKAEDEEKKVKCQMEEAKKEADKRQRQMERKKQVDEYKMEKAKEKARQEAQERRLKQQEEEERRRLSANTIERFQFRDQLAGHRKMVKEHQKEVEEKLKQERLEKLRKQVEVQVERDPSRLLRPTQGWAEKQRNQGLPEPSNGRVLQPVAYMHKAIPTWRQGSS